MKAIVRRPRISLPPTRLAPTEENGSSLNIVVHEYNAIRAEILTSLSCQVSILSFGSATVGLLAAAAASLWEKEVLFSAAILLLVIPSVCFLTLAIYGGELIRLMRAGLFMNRLENWINAACNAERLKDSDAGRTLTWEQWSSIRSGGQDVDKMNRIAISMVFVGMAVGSTVVGFIQLHIDQQVSEFMAVGGLVLSVLVGTASLLWLLYLGVFAYSYRKEYVYPPPRESEPSAAQVAAAGFAQVLRNRSVRSARCDITDDDARASSDTRRA